MSVAYTTREDVKSALESKLSARDDAKVDRAIGMATDSVHGLLHRRFYPELTTRYADWPTETFGDPAWRVYLGQNELISLSTLTSGGTVLSPADYFLRSSAGREEPPYDILELDRSSLASFGSGNTSQRSLGMLGLYGYRNDEAPAGALSVAIATTTATTCAVTDSAAIGVGQLVRVDAERMIVTGKSLLTTGQTNLTPLTAVSSNDLISVTDGSAFAVGESILLDSERMLIVDVAGNSLIVKRAQEGSTLAAHTAATIYAPRTLTVQRGALGTTAAAHLISAPVVKWVPPGLVGELAVAESLVHLAQMSSGYARMVGSNENEREASGRGLAVLRTNAYRMYGRKLRSAAV